VPNAFDLEDMFSGARRAVLTVWRGSSGVGVRFRDRGANQEQQQIGFGKRGL